MPELTRRYAAFLRKHGENLLEFRVRGFEFALACIFAFAKKIPDAIAAQSAERGLGQREELAPVESDRAGRSRSSKRRAV